MFKNERGCRNCNNNIAVKFEYCLLLDTISAENVNTVNETE